MKPNPESAHTEPHPDIHIAFTQNDQLTNNLPLADQAMEDSDSMVVYTSICVGRRWHCRH